jgi:hypothetical protein
MLGQQDIRDDLSSDIIELMEIAHTLARAETALLTSDRAKAVAELERLQTRAAALVSRLQREARTNAQAA